MGAPIGGNRKHNLCVLLLFCCYLYGKYIWIIGLKAPGNYSDQFRFNEISILLCEGPELQNAMISWFVDFLLMDYSADLWFIYGLFMADWLTYWIIGLLMGLWLMYGFIGLFMAY